MKVSAIANNEGLESLSVSARKLDGWFENFRTATGGFESGINGPSVTLWASSRYIGLPQIMSAAPYLHALSLRIKDESGDSAKTRASELVEWLLSSQDPRNGVFVAQGGESPFGKQGLVMQATAVMALCAYYAADPVAEVADAISAGLSPAARESGMLGGAGVFNQELKMFSAEIGAQNISIVSDAKMKMRARTFLERMKIFQYIDEPVKGFVAQSPTDHSCIAVYQAKCVAPLIDIYKSTGSDEAIELASQIAERLVQGFDSDEYLISESWIAMLPSLSYRLSRRIFRRLSGGRAFRSLHSVSNLSEQRTPVWIARSADAAWGLREIGMATGSSEFQEVANRMLSRVLSAQEDCGGFPTSYGFAGGAKDDVPTWQDAICVPRWNAYVALLLHRHLAGNRYLAPSSSSDTQDHTVNVAGGQVLIESGDSYSLRDSNSELQWVLKKGKRWGSPARSVAQWGDGSAHAVSSIF